MTLNAKEAPDLNRFNHEDPFLLEAQLTEEERMLRDAAKAYAQDKLQPRVIAAYREEQTDAEIFRETGKMGLLGVTIPEDMAGLVRLTSPTALSHARSSGSIAAIGRRCQSQARL